MKELNIDELVAFCKRKGFVYPSAEIYGGLAGFYDYGHLGALLKKNFENLWRQYFLSLSDNFFEIDVSEIAPEQVFIASGHLKKFGDIAAKCKKGHIERADHLLERKLKKRFEGLNADELFKLIKENNVTCSVCEDMIESVGVVDMMFPISLGMGNTTKAFLRPETAQGPYVNFKTQFELNRGKLPLGLALVGRAYRNELSPRNFLLRQRAFTQSELQIFFNPSKINEHSDFNNVKNYELMVVLSNQRGKGIQKIKCSEFAKTIPKFYTYYMAMVQKFYLDVVKLPKDKFRFYQLNDQEKAFYNKYHFDMEADLDSFGWTEIGGVHYRTDHDLKGHQEISKVNMSVLDEETKEKFIPHVLELSFGVDRNFHALVSFAYNYDPKRDNIVLKLPSHLAPVKVAVFPIVKNEEMIKAAHDIADLLKKLWKVQYDESGSIGRRYSRSDESGIPLCITVDEETIKEKTVTVRWRDNAEQIKINSDELVSLINGVIEGKDFFSYGQKVNTRKK